MRKLSAPCVSFGLGTVMFALPFAFETALKTYSMYILVFGAALTILGIVLGIRDYIKNRKNPTASIEQLNREAAEISLKNAKAVRSQMARDRINRIASGLPD